MLALSHPVQQPAVVLVTRSQVACAYSLLEECLNIINYQQHTLANQGLHE